MLRPDAEQVLVTRFRRQSGRMTAALVRMLGVRRLDLVEDLVQETLLAALQAWPNELAAGVSSASRSPHSWQRQAVR